MPTEEKKTAEHPEANVEPLGPIASGRLLQSKMWWVTILCLGVAGFLSWQSHRPTGFSIEIDFPEGHGLKPGDALEYRGIHIGVVSDVALSDDLHAIRTTVEVESSAKGVAVDGSQFWIVRPQLSLTNISGLETAVGSKYIAVSPGEAGNSRKRQFEGLKDPPALKLDTEGVEITLSGEESFGINPGSPVTYLGIPVGQIATVKLAPEATQVHVVATIDSEYRPLLRKGSKFWKTSGVDFDIGLRGVHLSTESLATVAKGGVSFVNPKSRDPEAEEVAAPGHVFELHRRADSDWLEKVQPVDWQTP